MGETTGIEWTDHTFNPWWGCIRVSPGCEHCYAETMAKRYGHDVWGPAKTTQRRTFGGAHWLKPYHWNVQAMKAGVRRRVFCASMADVFEEHPALVAERAKLWNVIRETPWLDWQLLTKRPENIARMLPDDWGTGYKNVWLGTSVEDQRRADERIPKLVNTPASIRFLSCEPLIGAVSLGFYRKKDDDELRAAGLDPAKYGPEWQCRASWMIDWVIIGGESGPGSRPMMNLWALNLLDECRRAKVAPFVKQLGRRKELKDAKGGDMNEWPEALRVREFPPSPAPREAR